MPWKRFRFKNNKVYVHTDEHGEPVVQRGRISLRYKLHDPRTYLGSPRNLSPLTDDVEAEKVWRDDEAAPLSDTSPGEAPQAGAGGNAQTPARDHAEGGEGAEGLVKSSPSRRRSNAHTANGERPYLNGLEPIVIYTDGACSGNPGPAGVGVVMICSGHRKELSEYLGEGTNNVAELTAILRGLQMVKSVHRTILLHTDSQYSIGVLSGWKAKANTALIQQIKQEMERFSDLRLIKVAGHAGVPENERCDFLARQAVTSRRSQCIDG